MAEEVHTVNIGAVGLRPVVRIDAGLFGVDETGTNRAFRATGARTFIGEFDGAVDMILGMNVLRLLQELRIAGGVPILIAAG